MSDRCTLKMYTDRGYHFRFKFFINTIMERRKTNCTDSYVKLFEGATNNDLLWEHCGQQNEIISSKSARVSIKYKKGLEGLNPTLKIFWNIVRNEMVPQQDSDVCDNNRNWNSG